MQFCKYNVRLDYLQELIRKERTGSPKELANHLNISERMVYRYLNELKEMDKQIVFCRFKKTYKYLPD